MSLVWMDGFDDLTGGAQDWTSSGYLTGGQETFVSAATPNGIGQSLTTDSESGAGIFTLNLATGPISDFIMGFHYLPSTEAVNYITTIYNGDGFGNYREVFRIITNEQAGLTAYIDGGPTLGVSTPNIIFPAVWYYFEVRANFQTGELTIRLDETIVLHVENIVFPFAVMNIVTFGGRYGGLYERKSWDNLVILDGSKGDAPFNDFLGECIVYTGHPTADVGPNNWNPIPNDGTLLGHYDAVNDITHNDADYLQIDSSGKEELFDMEDVPITTLEVLAVAVATRIQKVSGAPGQYQTIVKASGVQSNLPTRSATGNFSTKLEFMETKPGGGSWTIADANSLQVGLVTV